MELSFTKMQGVGNDFILIDFYDRSLRNDLDLNKVSQKLCDRHFGVGADGLILVLPSEKYELRMRMFNSDGSEEKMGGNAMRCFAKFAYENKLIREHKFSVETLAGEIIPELIFDPKKEGSIKSVKVNMGKPDLAKKNVPMIGNPDRQVVNEIISVENGQYFRVTCVSMGNPHCVIFIDDVKKFPVTEIGPLLENHHLFPEKTNVEFVQALNENEIELRVWERGIGETLGCGTGASAAVVAGILNKRIKSSAIVHLRGGDLEISWEDDKHVYMTGPAENVFSGTFLI